MPPVPNGSQERSAECMRESPTARARCPTLPGAREGVKAAAVTDASSGNKDKNENNDRPGIVPGRGTSGPRGPTVTVDPPESERVERQR